MIVEQVEKAFNKMRLIRTLSSEKQELFRQEMQQQELNSPEYERLANKYSFWLDYSVSAIKAFNHFANIHSNRPFNDLPPPDSVEQMEAKGFSHEQITKILEIGIE